MRTTIVAAIAISASAGSVGAVLGAGVVATSVVSIVGIGAGLLGTILFSRWWEQDPRGRAADPAALRGLSGLGPFGGGAIVVDFWDPDRVRIPPTVPEGHPHRTNGPEWASLPGGLGVRSRHLPHR